MGRPRRLQKCHENVLALDMFGYPVTLFYHKENALKKSYFGLVVSALMFVVVSTYVSILAERIGNPDY